MKAELHKASPIVERSVDELHLHPTSDADRERMQWISDNCEAIGRGYVDDKLDYLRIKLTRKPT